MAKMRTDTMAIGETQASAAESQFRHQLDQRAAPRVLELGTLRWESDRPTHHAAWMPAGTDLVMSDVEAGTDVDVVADAHDLVRVFGSDSFDAIVAVSVWEHLRWPWECADQARGILRPGGLLYVATHHAFPVHGYPSDFGRWTKEGLGALFEWGGLDVVTTGYAYPCKITPPREVTRWNTAAEAFLNVDVFARKP